MVEAVAGGGGCRGVKVKNSESSNDWLLPNIAYFRVLEKPALHPGTPRSQQRTSTSTEQIPETISAASYHEMESQNVDDNTSAVRANSGTSGSVADQ